MNHFFARPISWNKAMTVLFLLCTMAAYGEKKILFKDDFEDRQNLFSKEWRSLPKGIEIVPEDPTKPAGNLVARFLRADLTLATPLAPADLKNADVEQESIAHWKDYSLSLRFRLGKALMKDPESENEAKKTPFLSVMWHINPKEENPSLMQAFFLTTNKSAECLFDGPIIPTPQGHRHFQKANSDLSVIAGQEFGVGWHSLRVELKQSHTKIFYDEKLYFEGDDDRASFGGIAIKSRWNALTDPGYIDIDDVLVEELAP